MDEQAGNGWDKIAGNLQGLLGKCDQDPGYAIAACSVCVTLIRHLMADQPANLRRVWAIELYRLADTLAEPPEDISPEDRA